MPHAYPWYDIIVSSDSIEQGDLLFDCPIFVVNAKPDLKKIDDLVVQWETRDVIVMSQTCDLAHNKLQEVLLCAVWKRSDFDSSNPLSKAREMEKARRGSFPAYHVLAKCEPAEAAGDARVVDFRRIFSLPVPFVKQAALAAGPRFRLLPPYREHLSQAFARYFMRVGLPVDIPKFE